MRKSVAPMAKAHELMAFAWRVGPCRAKSTPGADQSGAFADQQMENGWRASHFRAKQRAGTHQQKPNAWRARDHRAKRRSMAVESGAGSWRESGEIANFQAAGKHFAARHTGFFVESRAFPTDVSRAGRSGDCPARRGRDFTPRARMPMRQNSHMKRIKYKLGLRNLPAREKMTRARRIVNGLARLPLEKRVHVRLEELQASRAETEALEKEHARLVVAARATLSRLKAARAGYFHKLDGAAVHLSFSAQSAADFQAAGLDVKAPLTPIGLAAAPTELRAVPVGGERMGKVGLHWKRPVRRCVFLIEYTSDSKGHTGWQNFRGTETAKRVVDGLEPGRLYWFRVAALNSAGTGPWSAILQARANW